MLLPVLVRRLSFFLLVLFFFNVYLIYFERLRERGVRRGTERVWSRLCSDNVEPGAGLKLMNRELMT